MGITVDIIVIVTLVAMSVYIRRQKATIVSQRASINTLFKANAKLWDMVDDKAS